MKKILPFFAILFCIASVFAQPNYVSYQSPIIEYTFNSGTINGDTVTDAQGNFDATLINTTSDFITINAQGFSGEGFQFTPGIQPGQTVFNISSFSPDLTNGFSATLFVTQGFKTTTGSATYIFSDGEFGGIGPTFRVESGNLGWDYLICEDNINCNGGLERTTVSGASRNAESFGNENWTFVAIVYEPVNGNFTDLKVYYNGVEYAENESENNDFLPFSFNNSGTDWGTYPFQSFSGSTHTWNFTIDELRFYVGTLNETEVNASYENYLNPPETPEEEEEETDGVTTAVNNVLTFVSFIIIAGLLILSSFIIFDEVAPNVIPQKVKNQVFLVLVITLIVGIIIFIPLSLVG